MPQPLRCTAASKFYKGHANRQIQKQEQEKTEIENELLPKKKQKMRPETAKVGRSLADKRSSLNVAEKGRTKQAPSNAKYYRENPTEI